MMFQVLIRVILLVVISTSIGYSQNFGFSTFHKCDTISGVRFGLISQKHLDTCRAITNGLRLELLGNGLKLDSGDYHPWIPLIDDLSFKKTASTFEKLNGLNISILGTRAALNVNSCSISLISQKVESQNGLQAALISNVSRGRLNGFQASIFRKVAVISNRLQLSISNYTIALNGLQIGNFNKNIENYGVQIGFFNRSNYNKGLQIGL